MITLEFIRENNVLMAQFLGMVYDNHNNQPNKYWELTDEQNFVSEKPYPQDKDLKFHSDWNWLMDVAKKIDEICGIDLHEWDNYINDALCSKNILTTYNVCVQFIHWYNKEK